MACKFAIMSPSHACSGIACYRIYNAGRERGWHSVNTRLVTSVVDNVETQSHYFDMRFPGSLGPPQAPFFTCQTLGPRETRLAPTNCPEACFASLHSGTPFGYLRENSIAIGKKLLLFPTCLHKLICTEFGCPVPFSTN